MLTQKIPSWILVSTLDRPLPSICKAMCCQLAVSQAHFRHLLHLCCPLPSGSTQHVNSLLKAPLQLKAFLGFFPGGPGQGSTPTGFSGSLQVLLPLTQRRTAKIFPHSPLVCLRFPLFIGTTQLLPQLGLILNWAWSTVQEQPVH